MRFPCVGGSTARAAEDRIQWIASRSRLEGLSVVAPSLIVVGPTRSQDFVSDVYEQEPTGYKGRQAEDGRNDDAFLDDQGQRTKRPDVSQGLDLGGRRSVAHVGMQDWDIRVSEPQKSVQAQKQNHHVVSEETSVREGRTVGEGDGVDIWPSKRSRSRYGQPLRGGGELSTIGLSQSNWYSGLRGQGTTTQVVMIRIEISSREAVWASLLISWLDLDLLLGAERFSLGGKSNVLFPIQVSLRGSHPDATFPSAHCPGATAGAGATLDDTKTIGKGG